MIQVKKKQSGQQRRVAAVRGAVQIQRLESRQLMDATYTVNTFADRTDPSTSSTISLRDAVAFADNNSTGQSFIKLPAGTYTLTRGELDLLAQGLDSITIEPVSGTPVISGDGNSRIFNVGPDTSATVTGLTIENGSAATQGGAIYVQGGLSMNSCTITNSSATNTGATGGAIYDNGFVSLTGCTVSNNSAGSNDEDTSSAGGGVFVDVSGNANITNSTITGNSAGSGGGICDGSSYTGNTEAEVVISSSTISNNSASFQGGGIYDGYGVQDAAMTATNATIINNGSEKAGGGIYDNAYGTFVNCTITGNDAGYVGIGSGGGGIYSAETTTLGNSVVAQNTIDLTSSATGIGTDYQGPVTSEGNNVIGIGDDNATHNQFSDGSDETGSTAFPLNPELSSPVGSPAVEIPIGEDQDNGPDSGNISSPLIDQGNNSLVTSSTDGRGLPRIVNGTVDIGAAETQLTIASITGTINVVAGVPITFPLGTFSDPGSTGPYTVSIEYAASAVDTPSTVNSTGSLGNRTATYHDSDLGDVVVTDGRGTVAVANNVFTINVEDTPPLLTGTTIGTSGSFQNDGDTIIKANDKDLTTFFNGPAAGTSAANDNWVGLDLGATGGVVTEVSYASRIGYASRLNGGEIQASNSPTFASGVTTLYTIGSNANPPSGTQTFTTLSNRTAYRYYRYLSPNGSYGNIAEIQFYGTTGGLANKLTGTTIGTSGSYQNDGDTIAKAVDGNFTTFFNGPTAGTSASNDNWVGLDLGATGGVVTEVAYASRSGFASRLNGGKIQASNSATFASGVTTLYTIGSSANPPSGSLTYSTFANSAPYRYYRYLSPNNSYGNIAEIEFLGTAGGLAARLTGSTIGTSGSYQNDGDTIAKAVDGNFTTFFNGPTAGTSAANDNGVGLDLGSAGGIVTEAAFASRSGFASRMNGGQIQASNSANFSSGVVTLYTIGSSANVPSGALTTVTFSNTTKYRYYRYLSPNGSYGNIAELQFFGTAG